MIWGISQAAPSLRDALTLAIPSRCADLIISGQADVALVPIAEIPSIPNATIITDYCLSAESEVDTVALLSNTPLNDIHTVYLDTDSRTSVQLARILAREKWHIAPRWIDTIPVQIKHGEAIVAIGDKVFSIQSTYQYKWDLAREWIDLTGLPIVFAAWVARTPQGLAIEQTLNEALRNGVQNIRAAIEAYPTSSADPYKYLTQNIKYNLTPQKRDSMQLFWEKRITPG